MRYRTWCAKVYEPWYNWGKKLEQEYQMHYSYWWKEYSKKLAEYNGLSIPTSMSGQRTKREYEYGYQMYEHYMKAYHAVNNERHAIKYNRMWRQYRYLSLCYWRNATRARAHTHTHSVHTHTHTHTHTHNAGAIQRRRIRRRSLSDFTIITTTSFSRR